MHSIIREVINACKAYTSVSVSLATISEFASQLDWARGQMSGSSIAGPSKLHPIIMTFERQRMKQPMLDARGFLGPYVDVEAYLENEGIDIESTEIEDVKQDALFDQSWRALRDVRADYVRDRVVTHDAVNFALVHRLRSERQDTVLGAPVWLLTRDRNLRTVERILSGLRDIPHCKYVNELDGWLLPLEAQAATLDVGEYVVYLMQSGLGVAAKLPDIETGVLDILRNPQLQISSIFELPQRLATKVLSELQSSEDARKLLNTLSSGDDVARAAADAELKDTAVTYLLEEAVLQESENKELRRLVTEQEEVANQLRKKLEEHDGLFAELEQRIANPIIAASARRVTFWRRLQFWRTV